MSRATRTKSPQDTRPSVQQEPAPQLPVVASAAPVVVPPAIPVAPPPVSPPQYPISVGKAIIAVQKAIGVIAKGGTNTFQKYNYVKSQDIIEQLSPILAENDLILVQSEVERSMIERNAQGSVLGVVYEFTAVHASTGESWPPIRWTSLARMMSEKGVLDDKAAAKAHTQAEKYFVIKLFKIRTDDIVDSDADNQGHPPPRARPDAMERPTQRATASDGAPSAAPVSPTSTAETTASPAATTAASSSTPGTPTRRDPSKPLTISEIAELERLAKEKAKLGTLEFGMFWRNLYQDERKIVDGNRSELRKILDEADAEIIRQEKEASGTEINQYGEVNQTNQEPDGI